MTHTPYTDDLPCRCLRCGNLFAQDAILSVSGSEYPGAAVSVLDYSSPCCRAQYDEESYDEYMDRHTITGGN